MIRHTNKLKVHAMAGKSYKIIELVGSSPDSWEEAVKKAVDTSCAELTNMRIAEVVELDTRLEGGKIAEYRAKVRLSFKVEKEPETL
jgi:flavin-binding protein dodecin